MKKNHNSENEFAKGPYTYEVCPHCGEEVELKNELMVQTCPNCGKRIVTCSMCRACDESSDYCTNCCLCHQAHLENEELGRLPIDEIEAIHDLLVRADLDDVSFICHRNKPTFMKDGIRYELFDVKRYDGDALVSITAKPEGQWKVEEIDLYPDTLRKVTLARIKKSVEDYLYKQGLL